MGLILAASAAVLLGGCDDDSAGPDAGVTVEDVTEADNVVEGHQVEISGRVEEVVSDHAFVIGGNDVIGDEPLMVISADVADELVEGRVVQVRGVVRRIFADRIQDDFGVTVDEAFGSELGEQGQSDLARQAAEREGRLAVAADEVEILR